jgi:hypothetical protein
MFSLLIGKAGKYMRPFSLTLKSKSNRIIWKKLKGENKLLSLDGKYLMNTINTGIKLSPVNFFANI